MARSSLRLIVRLTISCLLVGYLTLKVDWPSIISALKAIDIKLYVASTLLALVSSFFLAAKYHILIKETPIAHSLLSLGKINFISRFYALFLPSALGPDAVRWYKVTHNRNGRAFFLASIILERLTFVFFLLLCGSIPLFLYPTNSEIAVLRERLLPIILVALFCISAFIAYFIFPVLQSYLRAMVMRLFPCQGKEKNIILFLQNFSIQNKVPTLFLYIFLLSLLWQIFFLGRIFILFKTAALPLSFIDVAWMGSLVLLLQVIPISFAGIGVRECAYGYLFTVFKLPPEKGVLIGILFFVQMLVFAGIGGLLELAGKD